MKNLRWLGNQTTGIQNLLDDYTQKSFKNCNPETPIERRELLVVQNRSTMMALTEARTFQTQAIYSLGVSQLRNPENEQKVPTSVLAFLKISGLNQVWKTQEVWSFEKNRSIDSLQFQKIICCTDPSEQGDSIKFGFLMWLGALYPQLFVQGRVFEIAYPKYKVFMNEQVQYLYEDLKEEPKQPHEAIHGLSLASMTQQDLIQCCTNQSSRGVLRLEWDQEIEDDIKSWKFVIQPN